MALLSPAFIVGPSLVFFHTLLKKLAQLCKFLLGLIGLRCWNVLVFVWVCACELWSRVNDYTCVCVCWWVGACVWFGGCYFCTFLLVRLMGTVLSCDVLWIDAKLSVIGQKRWMWFSPKWIAHPGRSWCYSPDEANTIPVIFTAFHEKHANQKI